MVRMLKIQALLIAVFLIPIVGCDGNGQCDAPFHPELCEQRDMGVQLNPPIDHPITNLPQETLSAYWTEGTPERESLIGELVDEQGNPPVVSGAALQPIGTTPLPSTSFTGSIPALSLMPGNYYLKLSFTGYNGRVYELTRHDSNNARPFIALIPKTLSWPTSPSMQIDLPVSDFGGTMKPPCYNTNALQLYGIWVGLLSNKPVVLARQKYCNTNGSDTTVLQHNCKSCSSWFSWIDKGTNYNSPFDLWSFMSQQSTSSTAIYLGETNTNRQQYKASAAPLDMVPSMNAPFLTLMTTMVNDPLTKVALAVKDDAHMAFLTLDQLGNLAAFSLSGNVLTSLSIPSSIPATQIQYIVGYAKNSDGTTGIGFLLFDKNNTPYFITYDGLTLGSDMVTSAQLSMILDKSNAIGVVAVGDIDGDNLTDIAVAHGSQINIYLRWAQGFYSVSNAPMISQSIATMAIGDVDGDHKSDIVISDGKQQGGCGNGTNICSNTLYVYLQNH